MASNPVRSLLNLLALRPKGSPHKGRLEVRIVLSILIVGLATAAVSLSLIYFVGKRTLERSIGGNFKTLAEIATNDLDTIVSDNIRVTQSLAASATIFSTIEESNYLYEGSSAEETQRRIFELEGRWVHAQGVDAYLLELLTNKEAAALREFMSKEKERAPHLLIFVTNDRGAVVAATNRPPHYYYGDKPWWQTVYNQGKGKVYVSNIEYDREFDAYTFTVAAPVVRDGQVLGVITRILDSSFFFRELGKFQVGKTDHLMLATSQGEVLVCPKTPAKSHHLSPSFTQRIFQPKPGWVVTENGPHFPGDAAINGFAPVRSTFNLSPADFGGQQWYVFTSQDPKETYAPIYILLESVGVAAGLGAIVLVVLGVLVSRRIVRPILDLQKGTEIIGAGNLNHQIQISTGDEIEDLATKFNDMTYRLKIARIRLEEVVKERTRELEQRNRELKILDALNATLNQSVDLEEILSETLAKMLEVMKADAGVIWMPDPKSGDLAIRMAKEFSMEEPGADGLLRVMDFVNDVVAESSDLWSSEDLLSDERIDPLRYKEPIFKSLVAVPLVSKYKVSGILHLFYRNVTGLTSREEKLLLSLGTNIGVALEYAMLFAKNLFKELEGPAPG
jgi:HAMP domain-containing protein